ncbi:MAG: hypothetical protein HN623_05175, partial [Bdellovibrionales bacterium]|nr:hypothetical protein [Bdellovibrionales bacterium]
MEIDEKIFHLLWKSKKKLFAKKIPPHALHLDQMNERMILVASMLFGRLIRVKPGPG